MTDKYPYFIYPDVIALRNPESGLSPEERERIIRKIAANVGDIPALRLMLGLDSEEFARFYPDMKASTPSTSDTIDTFLSRFGRQDAPVSKAAEEIGTDYTDKQFDDNNANSVNNVNNVNNDSNDDIDRIDNKDRKNENVVDDNIVINGIFLFLLFRLICQIFTDFLLPS